MKKHSVYLKGLSIRIHLRKQSNVMHNYWLFIILSVWAKVLMGQSQSNFAHNIETVEKPWTQNPFDNDSSNFQFAIVSDRTGGHRPGVFGKALKRLNTLHPEFVMSVGDLIEGYTTDDSLLSVQWAEFDSILHSLDTRFFALPGNHDISNETMRQRWIERYGKTYYHFIYKDVLFLAMDTNDGDGVMFSQEQIDYFHDVLKTNTDVRWTMVFMHHPIWQYRAFNGFDRIEEALKNRQYTVLAGHTHRYMKSVRQNRNYYILATTGGGSRLTGPRFGQFDHVSWITMTNDGPDIVHLQLDGILPDDILSEDNAIYARNIIEAARQKALILKTNENSWQMYLPISNQMESTVEHSTLAFHASFYHNHKSVPAPDNFEKTIAPGKTEVIQCTIKHPTSSADTLELDWTFSFPNLSIDPPFELSGIKDIVLHTEPADFLQFEPMDIFLDRHQITMEVTIPNVEIRYTLDGSIPNGNSQKYENAIPINETTNVKAIIYDPAEKAFSDVLQKTYQKVSPLESSDLNKSALKNGLAYKYYEGHFMNLPNFDTCDLKTQGVTQDFNVEALSQRKDHFGLQLEGFIDIQETGIYTFLCRSDDGSRLFIDDQLVVDNDGSHSARTRNGNIALEEGLHSIRIEYFEDFLGQELGIYYLKSGEASAKELSFDALFYSL